MGSANQPLRYPRGIPNRLVVALTNGTQLTEENEFPRGHDQNPMSDEEVTAKFRRLSAGVLDPAAQQQVLDLCWRLEELETVDDLMRSFPAVARWSLRSSAGKQS